MAKLRKISIYLVTNTVNGKRYVGQTRRNPTFRWQAHQSGSAWFLADVAIYGADAFRFQVLDDCFSREEANYKERVFIELFNCLSHGYNGISQPSLKPIERSKARRHHQTGSINSDHGAWYLRYYDEYQKRKRIWLGRVSKYPTRESIQPLADQAMGKARS
ncbi:MAG: GIY-YIG nuclease family protein [Terriglobales bacterium]